MIWQIIPETRNRNRRGRRAQRYALFIRAVAAKAHTFNVDVLNEIIADKKASESTGSFVEKEEEKK